MEDFVEIDVCPNDLHDKEMREVTLIGEDKVLLIKDGNKITATGPKCSHYGAPLIKGTYSAGVIRCPWHGACFNATSGDIEDFPGLDSIPAYDVLLKGDRIFVRLSKKFVNDASSKGGSCPVKLPVKRTKAMCKRDRNVPLCVLVIGGGAAATAAVEALRQNGFKGRIVMATEEETLPYDRPKLSKAMNADVSSLLLRDSQFFSSVDVEVLLKTRVKKIDFKTKSAFCQEGTVIDFSHVLIATGSRPLPLDVPGLAKPTSASDLDSRPPSNVKYLRTPQDAKSIDAEARDANVVILGSGFIGMEVAAYLSDKSKSVTLISRASVPLRNVVGKTLGDALKRLHESKGINFKTGVSICAVEKDSDGRVTAVMLKGKDAPQSVLFLDLLVVGAGVVPNSELLAPEATTGVKLNRGGYVAVDKHLRSSAPFVWAAGDVAEFPLPLAEGKRVSIGHWQMALKMGETAGKNIARAVAIAWTEEVEERGSKKDVVGNKAPTVFDSIPFFWSVQYGKSLRYAGFAAQGYTEVVLHGELKDVENLKFVAFYLFDDGSGNERVVAAASLNWDPLVAKFADLLKNKRRIDVEMLRENPENILKLD